MKSGNLNILEPSGPLQVCNGADLHLKPTEFFLTQFITFFILLLLFLLHVI